MDIPAKAFTIPDVLCQKAGMAATWAPFNKLGIFAFQPVNSKSQDCQSSFAPCDGKVHQVREEIILFEPVLRKLVNESNGTFLDVQNTLKNKNVDVNQELIKFSREYRSIIRACLENLQESSLKSVDHLQKEDLANFITIFYSIECLWHLCEIVFVENIPGNMILNHLMDWIRFHFPKYERSAAKIFTGDLQSAENHPQYWDTVIGCLLQGRIDITIALLKLHNASDSQAFKLVDNILKSMPVYDVYGGVSVTEFNVRWKHWKVDVQSELDAKMFVTEKHLQLMMRLIIGEESAWDEMRPKYDDWYELMVNWLYYTEPTIKSFEVGQYAKLWVSRFGGEQHMKHLDHVILAVLKNDLLEVIKQIQFMSENGWFVTHLTDLLFHSGRLQSLDKNNKKIAKKIREGFLVDYGTVLMEHKSLWQVALSYFDHCPTKGRQRIEHLLSRLPLDNEQRVSKIIREAQKRKLNNLVSSICKIQGMKSLRNKRVGNALTWAIRSQDGTFTSYLADKFLKEYSTTGQLSNIDLLDNLGSCMLVSDKLIFLAKYCEFHKVYQSKIFKEAATLLVSLLASRITPKYFWFTLLMDALPLLEHDEIVMSSTDTLTLLHCLEERLQTPGLDKDKISLIRLAITRNLPRALIQEAQQQE